MSDPAYITVRKHTFLSCAALGFSAIVVTLLISSTVVLLYTVHLAGAKSERVITLAQSAIKGLPDFANSLPPALADMLDDRRRPDYCKELAITAKTTSQPDAHGRMRTTVEVVNNGPEVVSLLSLRILLLDGQNQLVSESQEWAATPLAADEGWRGPIMPGSRRLFACHHAYYSRPDDTANLDTQVEITELRVWNAEKNSTPPDQATASSPTPDAPAQQG